MPDTIGEAAVSIVPDTSGFEGMLKGALEAPLKAAESLFGVAGKAAVGLGAAVVGVGAASVALAATFESSLATIGARTGQTKDQVKAIGDAFLSTAGQTTFSANAIATAFAPVSGQLQLLEGGSLSAAQSLQFMQAAMALAESTGSDLGTTTSDLSGLLQNFGIDVSSAGHVTDQLFSVSTALNVPVSDLVSTFEALHGKLGNVGGGIEGLSALMVDLAQHGETGSRAIRAVSGELDHLLSGAKPVGEEVKKLGLHLYDANGQFVGMRSIIGQLQPELLKMTDAQRRTAVDALFGQGAYERLGNTLLDGVAAYDAAAQAADKHGAAADAAAKATDTFKGSLEKIKSQIEDAGIKLGNILLPKIEAFIKKIEDWFHSPGFHALENWFKTLWQNLQPAISAIQGFLPVFSGFSGWVSSYLIQPLASFVQSALPQFVLHFAEAFGPSGVIGQTASNLQTAIKPIFDTLKQLFSDVTQWFTTVLLPKVQEFGKAVLDALPGLVSFGSFVLDHVIQPLVNFAQTVIPPIIQLATDFIKAWLPQLEAFGKGLAQYVIEPLINIAKTVIPPLITAADWVVQHFGFLVPLIGGLAATLATMWAVDKIYLWSKTVIGVLSNLGPLITSFVGKFTPNLPGLPGTPGGIAGTAGSKLAPQDVFVVNWEMMALGGKGAGAVGAAESGLGKIVPGTAIGAGSAATAASGAAPAITGGAALAAGGALIAGDIAQQLLQVKLALDFVSTVQGIKTALQKVGVNASDLAHFSLTTSQVFALAHQNTADSWNAIGQALKNSGMSSDDIKKYIDDLKKKIGDGSKVTQDALNAVNQHFKDSGPAAAVIEDVLHKLGPITAGQSSAFQGVMADIVAHGGKASDAEGTLAQLLNSGAIKTAPEAQAFLDAWSTLNLHGKGAADAQAALQGAIASGQVTNAGQINTFLGDWGALTGALGRTNVSAGQLAQFQATAASSGAAFSSGIQNLANSTGSSINTIISAITRSAIFSQNAASAYNALAQGVQREANFVAGRPLGSFQHGGVMDFGKGTPIMAHGVEAILAKDRTDPALWEAVVASIRGDRSMARGQQINAIASQGRAPLQQGQWQVIYNLQISDLPENVAARTQSAIEQSHARLIRKLGALR